MEATWISMEKKEKIMWIKKAAEDQKRYEVSVPSFRTLNSSVLTRHRRALTCELTVTNRGICARCVRLLPPSPQGRRWSLRANPRNRHRTSVPSHLLCVSSQGTKPSRHFFSHSYFWHARPETATRSSPRRCCPTESSITSRWRRGWPRSAAAGRVYRWRRRTATRRSQRRSRGSTKSSWNSGSL